MANIETGYWTDSETVEFPPSAAEYQSWAANADKHGASRAPADRGRGFIPPELQQTAAGEPSASTRRETCAYIISVYF